MNISSRKWKTIRILAMRRGVSSEAVRKWRERNNVPGDWHLILLSEAARTGASLQANDLIQGLR